MNQKLRDDMMHFDGLLDALEWAAVTNRKIPCDMIERMREQYQYFLKRLYEDYEV